MPSLLETIRSGLGAQVEPIQMTDETARAQKLLRAKTGRVVPGAPTPAPSAFGEAAAVQQAQLGQQQLQQQAKLTGEQIASTEAGIRQEEQLGREALAQRRRAGELQMRLQTNELFGEVEREGRKLNLEKDRAKLEQLATGLALQDRQYLQKLQDEGRRSRLTSQIDFEQAMEKSVLGANADLIRQELGYDSLFRAKKRDLNRALSDIDIRSAIQIMNNEIAAANQRAKWEGIGTLATGAAAGVGKAEERGLFNESETPSPEPFRARLGYRSPEETYTSPAGPVRMK